MMLEVSIMLEASIMLEVSIMYGAKPHKKQQQQPKSCLQRLKTFYPKREMERVW